MLKKTVNLTKKLGQTLGQSLGQTTQTQTPITNTDTDAEGDWYIGTDDGKLGPMTAEKVLNMMDTGELDKTNGNAFIAHSSYGKIPSWKPLDQEAEGMLLRSYRANMIVDDRMSVPQPHTYDEDDSVIHTDAYYTIVGMWGNKTETGSALLIQVNNKFGGVKRVATCCGSGSSSPRARGERQHDERGPHRRREGQARGGGVQVPRGQDYLR